MKGQYYKTKASVEEYINAAKGFDGKKLIDKLKQVLPNQSSLLEIGSGPGTDWKLLNAFYDITGSDNSKEFIEHLVSNNTNGKFIELDAESIKTDLKFDGIYSNKVLHHLKDEELTISVKRQNDILNSSGIVCHSFWKGEGSEVFKGLFVNYHTVDSISKVFEPYFEILTIEKYKEFDENDSFLLIARKK